MKIPKSIIITGNHHTPAIELISILRQDSKFQWQISYLGHQFPSDTHISHTITDKLKIPFYNLESGKFDRKSFFNTFTNIPKIFFAFLKSITLINQIRPDIIVSFGGYVSVPVIIAAFLRRIPSITHEQTLTLSLSTKINSIFVNKVALSFDLTKNEFIPKSKIVTTGNLIRQEIFNRNSHFFNFLNKQITLKPLLYITGGSQGSQYLNHLIKKILPQLTNYTIIHQTGNLKHLCIRKQNYHSYEYIEINDIGWILNNSEIIISRAGANICQEIDILGKKSILIPHPFTQQNEQLLNARWLQRRHPQKIIVLQQTEATSDKLLNAINKLSHQKHNLPSAEKTKPNTLLSLIHQFV